MNSWTTFNRDLLEQMPLILSGLQDTILLAVSISISGILLGILVFYLTLSQYRWVRYATNAYISFFIGMPLIVLLFLMYYGLPQWDVRLTPFTVAFIGFTFNVAAYNAAYLTTAINGLNKTEIEAGRAQGFSHFQVFRFLILPQTFRLSVPALTNQIISNLKDTSVAFLIQYTEFFARVQELASTNFQFFKAYVFAALIYLALVSIIVIAARKLEQRIVLPGFGTQVIRDHV
jgi:polar amino acid transport system permease protein